MQEVELSIIVPVYNAEKYIELCMQSVLRLNEKSVEVIIVDDGSKDASFEMCKKIAEEHPIVHLYKKENGGVSSARNLGLNEAKGRYIIFCDADDYINISDLKALCKSCKDSEVDVCFFGYYRITENQEKRPILAPDFCGKKNPELLLELIEKNVFGLACNKLIKREFLIKNGLLFDEKIRVFEDLDWMMRVWSKATFISSVEEALYFYVSNGTSAMQEFRAAQSTRYFSMHNLNLSKLESFMLENGIEKDKVDRYLFRYVSSEMGNIIRLAGRGTKQDFKTFKSQFEKSELLRTFNKIYKTVGKKSLKGKVFWMLSKRDSAFLMRWIGKLFNS